MDRTATVLPLNVGKMMSTKPIRQTVWRGTKEEKRAYAIAKSAENAAILSKFLGFPVSEKMPGVLLNAAARIAQSVSTRRYLADICTRRDHYNNCMKVLTCAIVHYDLARNCLALRNRETGKHDTCQNTIFARLDMAPSTVDNCLATLKRAGIYLSIERCEPKLIDNRWQKRAIASIKRINAAVFALFGLEKELERQQQSARDRRERRAPTPCERMFRGFARTSQQISEKRAATRLRAKTRRAEALIAAEAEQLQAPTQPSAPNATQMILDLINAGMTPDQARAQIAAATKPVPMAFDFDDPLTDIPY